jgi:hypothetical protein
MHDPFDRQPRSCIRFGVVSPLDIDVTYPCDEGNTCINDCFRSVTQFSANPPIVIQLLP